MNDRARLKEIKDLKAQIRMLETSSVENQGSLKNSMLEQKGNKAWKNPRTGLQRPMKSVNNRAWACYPSRHFYLGKDNATKVSSSWSYSPQAVWMRGWDWKRKNNWHSFHGVWQPSLIQRNKGFENHHHKYGPWPRSFRSTRVFLPKRRNSLIQRQLARSSNRKMQKKQLATRKSKVTKAGNKRWSLGDPLFGGSTEAQQASTINQGLSSLLNRKRKISGELGCILQKAASKQYVLIQSESKKLKVEMLARKKRLKSFSKKEKTYCLFFNKFGKCKKGKDCAHIHDKCKVAICRDFLKNACDKGDKCTLSHVIDRCKMPVCSFFLKHGACTNEDCQYRHVKVNKDAKACPEYQKGWCPRKDNCSFKHVKLKRSAAVGSKPRIAATRGRLHSQKALGCKSIAVSVVGNRSQKRFTKETEPAGVLIKEAPACIAPAAAVTQDASVSKALAVTREKELLTAKLALLELQRKKKAMAAKENDSLPTSLPETASPSFVKPNPSKIVHSSLAQVSIEKPVQAVPCASSGNVSMTREHKLLSAKIALLEAQKRKAVASAKLLLMQREVKTAAEAVLKNTSRHKIEPSSTGNVAVVTNASNDAAQMAPT